VRFAAAASALHGRAIHDLAREFDFGRSPRLDELAAVDTFQALMERVLVTPRAEQAGEQ